MERVIPVSRYNYYKYYNLYKEKYKINYELKKKKDELEEKNKEFYKDYWTLSLWKEENMREYKKNKIIINNNNET